MVNLTHKTHRTQNRTRQRETETRVKVIAIVFPISLTNIKSQGEHPIGTNLNQLANSSACSILEKDRSIKCIPEQLTSSGPGIAELPTINYKLFNGKKYKYFYSLSRPDNNDDSILGIVSLFQSVCLSLFCYPLQPSYASTHKLLFCDHPCDILSLVLSSFLEGRKLSFPISPFFCHLSCFFTSFFFNVPDEVRHRQQIMSSLVPEGILPFRAYICSQEKGSNGKKW